ncbi:VOC family protein [Streptomyces sp. A7024]|uniref:VOC family protein n=1 Tax=Streptomyces coryli TaxID=1128680 RepID=A0A6G4U3F1_9ACTN|nr:VOC family protein [Streptomyces coryli]
MASIQDLVFDSPHPASSARFWAQVLDDYEIAPYDEEELARLRSRGIDDPEDDPTVLLVAADASLPRIFFQLVPEGKRAKNRLHLDLRVADAVAEAERLCGLGATVQAEREEWITMQDPDGNEFCLMRS